VILRTGGSGHFHRRPFSTRARGGAPFSGHAVRPGKPLCTPNPCGRHNRGRSIRRFHFGRFVNPPGNHCPHGAVRQGQTCSRSCAHAMREPPERRGPDGFRDRPRRNRRWSRRFADAPRALRATGNERSENSSPTIAGLPRAPVHKMWRAGLSRRGEIQSGSEWPRGMPQ